jgi:thioesterase domain-containing protein
MRAGVNVLWSEKLYQAALRYAPQAYAGKVLILEPSDRLDVAGLEESWKSVTQPKREIQQLAADHQNALEEPMAQELAAHIRRAVEEADVSPTRSMEELEKRSGSAVRIIPTRTAAR